MNYSIDTASLMNPALPSADGGFPLAGFGKGFTLGSASAPGDLGPFLAGPSAPQSVFSLDASQHLNPLTGTPTYSQAQIKKVSQNFESIFMRMMFKEMRDSVQKSDLFGNTQAMDTFQSMYDDRLSDVLSAAGGIGLGNLIYQQLEKATGPHQTTRS